MTTTSFYLLQGTLQVQASGYWYTSGGEKGSFGYYPHLKNTQEQPVYPDTQLHGDLRMGALWSKGLGVDAACIDRLFGIKGNEAAALLHLGDLTVASHWDASRFQVKPRIEIDDTTRSVKKSMLANFEAAWLDGLPLEAPLYAGYFKTVEEMETARTLLEESAALLSGFGSLRSRGYGRGRVSILWQQAEEINISAIKPAAAHFLYSLKSLVNVRSKPVAAEQLQLVGTNLSLTAEQLRGWLVRTFHQVSGRWPDATEMASIGITDLHPSPEGNAAFPPPLTTLRKEDGSTIEDYFGRDRERTDDNETMLKCKLKPLKPGSFVTADGRVHEVAVSVRMRNAMEDGEAGGSFSTRKEGGLFVQQYLAEGTCFSGSVELKTAETDFSQLVYAILTRLKPTINGTLFNPATAVAQLPGHGKTLLLTMAQLFSPEKNLGPEEALLLGTQRRYSPSLGRPRRGRPSLLPGSVLAGEASSATVAWAGFGRVLQCAAVNTRTAASYVKPVVNKPLAELGIKWEEITRSQAGNLRELLNPDHDVESIGKFLVNIKDKYMEKNPSADSAKLYSALCNILSKEGADGLNARVKEIVDYLKTEIWWDKKHKCAGGDSL